MHQGRQQYASQKQKGMLQNALNTYAKYVKCSFDVFDVVFYSYI